MTLIKSYLALFSLMFVSVLMLMPFNLPGLFPHMDKVGHVLLFGGLTFIFSSLFTIRKAVLITIFLGLSIESLQYFVINRTASVIDITSNIIGVILCWAIVSVYTCYQQKEKCNDRI